MFLITTADQRFWPSSGPVLFLGEWCKLYDQKHVYNRIESETLPYHWDDRSRLCADHRYLSGVYEKYLDALVPKLNDVHAVSHSTRFWRIIVGPWLRYFIEIFYDRYLSICAAANRQCVSDTLVADTSRIMPPLDFPEFNKWFASDSYNHKLYSWLIERTQCLPFHKLSTRPEPVDPASYMSIGRDIIAGLISSVARVVPAEWTQISLVTTQLSAVDLLRLSRAVRQFPRPAAPPIRVKQRPSADPSLRQRLLLQDGNTPFEQLLDAAIAEHIPLAHMEAFEELRTRALEAYPRGSNVIVTSAAETFDEAFKIWSASLVDKGATFTMSQHGGSFGACLWMSTEEHQISISNRFYSWGWSDLGSPSIKPMAAFKLVGIEKRIRYSNSGRILWALTSAPRYSYRMFSIPVAGQFLSYLEDQFRLASALPQQVRDRITVRLYPESYGWNEGLRWREKFPDIEVDYGAESMEKQLSRSSLFISTYNATTFLETLAADFPTIISWNPLYWELRPNAQPYYDLLQEVGIFHTSPESAALRIIQIYDDPLKWWSLPAVQKVRLQFCERFARTSKDWIKEWKLELSGLNRSSSEGSVL